MSLAHHLQHQHQAVERLIGILGEERQVLTCARIDGQQLAALTARKQHCLEQLQTLESKRRRGQQLLGYASGGRGATQAARDQGCLAAWCTLQELAGRARRLNQINGQTLQLRLRQNQRILNCLNEMAGRTLYGPDGLTA